MSLRGAKRRSNPVLVTLDCFAGARNDGNLSPAQCGERLSILRGRDRYLLRLNYATQKVLVL